MGNSRFAVGCPLKGGIPNRLFRQFLHTFTGNSRYSRLKVRKNRLFISTRLLVESQLRLRLGDLGIHV